VRFADRERAPVSEQEASKAITRRSQSSGGFLGTRKQTFEKLEEN
jgi:hypothetical protein